MPDEGQIETQYRVSGFLDLLETEKGSKVSSFVMSANVAILLFQI